MRNKKHIFIISTILLTLGIYTISLIKSPYFFWDDYWMLVENPYLLRFDREALYDIFFSSYRGQYSPINTIIYSLVANLFGVNSLVFHILNLIIHIINTFLVFLFIKRLLQLKKDPAYKKNKIELIAFSVSLLFGISPMQIEAVAWISASKIIFYSFFFLLSIILYLRYLDTQKNGFHYLSLFFFLLSIGSKEQAVILPIALFIIILYLNKKKNVYLSLIPYFVLSLLFGVSSLLIQSEGYSKTLTNDYYPFYQRLVLSCYMFTQYIVKLLLPIRQWMFYEFPMKPGSSLPFFYWVYPIIVLLLLYIVYSFSRLEKFQYLVFGISFFFVNIFLTLHIIPLGRLSLMADRYLYIPSIGVFFCLIIYVTSLYNKAKNSFQKNLIIGGAILYIFLTYLKSIYYIVAWSNYWPTTI